jgi:hypothetical protein
LQLLASRRNLAFEALTLALGSSPTPFLMRLAALLFSAALLLTVQGCKDDPVSPRTGTLIFRADAGCTARTVELTVDDVVKGQYAMHPATTVQSFTVTEGDHTAEAREIGGAGLAWSKTPFNVRPNETFTLNMLCA